MRINDVNPTDLAILTEALDHNCEDRSIKVGLERDPAARRIPGLFQHGSTDAEQLKELLDRLDGR